MLIPPTPALTYKSMRSQPSCIIAKEPYMVPSACSEKERQPWNVKVRKWTKNAARNQRDITGIWRTWVITWHQAFTNSGRKRQNYNKNLEIFFFPKFEMLNEVSLQSIVHTVCKSLDQNVNANIEQMSLYSENTELKQLHKQVLLIKQLFYNQRKQSCQQQGLCFFCNIFHIHTQHEQWKNHICVFHQQLWQSTENVCQRLIM